MLTRSTYRVLPFISAAAILGVWGLAAWFIGKPNVLPNPLIVAKAFQELLENGALLRHSVASLFRVTAGFFIAAALGIPLGIFIGRVALARGLIEPVISFLRPISPLAWIPLAMLWFGLGDLPAVFLIFLASFFPLVVSTAVAVSHINQTYFQVAANFRFSRMEVITRVILPAILPDIFTALRITVSIAWLVVVAAEMIAVRSGLGYLIFDARSGLRMDYVLVGMVAIGVIGVFLDQLMLYLSRLPTTAWKGRI